MLPATLSRPARARMRPELETQLLNCRNLPSPPGVALRIIELVQKNRNIKLVGNEFAPVPRRDQLVLPRGGKHFSEMVDRAIIPQIEGI